MSSEVDFSQLTVVLANPEQTRKYVEWTHAHEPWGDGMTIEEFQAIVDKEMAEGLWAQDHADLTWVLVHRLDSSKVYAGCETHRTKALIKRQGESDAVETYAYGITNVVTSAAQRRKGYARHFLRVLHYVLAGPKLPPFPSQWGGPPVVSPKTRLHVPYASFSYLSSDVGQTYYASCTIGLDLPGYLIDPAAQNQLSWRMLAVPEGDLESSKALKASDNGWQVLYEADFPRIKAILSEAQRYKLAEMDTTAASAFALDPISPGTLEMISHRGLMSCHKPWPNPPHLEPRGVQRGDAIVMFARENYQIATDTLLITFTHDLAPEDPPSLLPVLDRLAAEVGLVRGWVWGLEQNSALVKAWEEMEGREAKASVRDGLDDHLYGVAKYTDQEGQLVDQQMWIWL